MSYEFMLAARYLRSRRHENFVSLIGWSSGIGIAIGVATLIVVLSVMIGAGVELRDRILGLSPHVDIQGAGDKLKPWREWVSKTELLQGVDVALPYVTTQVMITHGQSVSGAILKGVDVTKEDVLASYVVSGNFNDLATGENPFRIRSWQEAGPKTRSNSWQQGQSSFPLHGNRPLRHDAEIKEL